MAAATFLHTGMRAPAPESRRQELEELIAALDKGDFNKSLFAQFNALHPKLGNTLEEVEDFKRLGKIPPQHVLDRWREMGEQVSAKGHENLGQALTNATEIYGHLQAIQNDGDVVGATMGLLGSLQNGFSKSRNGGFIGGIYQQLNDLSRQISTVYFHLSHQIEAANQRNIREHQTTRYDLAVMARGIQGYLDTLQRSSREHGACMVHYMQNLGGKLDSHSQHTNYMLDELAMDPFQQALFSIDSQYTQDEVRPERLTAQMEILERWLKQPLIKQKLNGTFFAQQPKEEQLAFLRGVQPSSSQFVGFMAHLLQKEGLDDLPNVPLMGAILSGYEKAQLKLIEANYSYDSQGKVLQEIEKRLVKINEMVQALKSRETFIPFVQKQHKALLDAQQAAVEAMEMAHKATMGPIRDTACRTLKTEFEHAVEQTLGLPFHLETRVNSDALQYGVGKFLMNALDTCSQNVVAPLEEAKKRYKEQAFIQPSFEKLDIQDLSVYKPLYHYAILKSEDPYLRPTLLPLHNLHTISPALQKALTLERMGVGRVIAEASLEGMTTQRSYFVVSQAKMPEPLFSVKIRFFYLCQRSAGEEQKIIIQRDLVSLPFSGTDPLQGVMALNAWGGPLYFEWPNDGDTLAYNPDALSLILTARWDNAVDKEPKKSDSYNEQAINTKLERAVQEHRKRIHSHVTYEATAAKALLDQAKLDYEHARMMLCSYAEWMGMEMPKYPIASSNPEGEFFWRKLPDAPVFREPPKTAVETAVESLQHTIPQVRVNLAKRRAQQVEVVDEQKESDEMGKLKARVEAQARRIEELMAIVLMQQKEIFRRRSEEE